MSSKLAFIAILIVMCGCGKSDKATDANGNLPSDLVIKWLEQQNFELLDSLEFCAGEGFANTQKQNHPSLELLEKEKIGPDTTESYIHVYYYAPIASDSKSRYHIYEIISNADSALVNIHRPNNLVASVEYDKAKGGTKITEKGCTAQFFYYRIAGLWELKNFTSKYYSKPQ